jgi:hypothetical protein
MMGSKPKMADTEDLQGKYEDREPDGSLTTADMAAAGRSAAQPSPDFMKRPDQMNAVPARAGWSGEETSALLDNHEADDFRARWERIQTGFVDEPRSAVEQADKLVASAMSRLAEVFAAEREKLEREWAKGDDVSTEDLRIALRRYRSFFDRLLSV